MPGNRHPASAYFTRGTGHDEHAVYTEDPQVWYRMMERLKRKYETARKYVPAPVLRHQPGASEGIISFGSTQAAIGEAQDQLLKEHGLPTDFLRLRGLPFTEEVREFVAEHETIYVVEMNRDGQLNQLLTIEYPEQARTFRSVAYQDGLPAAARWIREGILAERKTGGGDGTKSKRNSKATSTRRSSSARRTTAKSAARRKSTSRTR